MTAVSVDGPVRDERGWQLVPPSEADSDPDGVFRKVVERALALLILVAAAPILLAAAIAILISDGRPVFFVDERVGRGGRRFGCLKLRTMRNAPELLKDYLAANPDEAARFEQVRKLRRDPRVTPVGALLRKTSVDELPQLFNVLGGHMSLVGPRPVTMSELMGAGRHARDLVSVRPGITGLWQVSGRSDLTLRRRHALERLEIRRRSFRRDLVTLVRTPVAVVSRRGAR